MGPRICNSRNHIVCSLLLILGCLLPYSHTENSPNKWVWSSNGRSIDGISYDTEEGNSHSSYRPKNDYTRLNNNYSLAQHETGALAIEVDSQCSAFAQNGGKDSEGGGGWWRKKICSIAPRPCASGLHYAALHCTALPADRRYSACLVYFESDAFDQAVTEEAPIYENEGDNNQFRPPLRPMRPFPQPPLPPPDYQQYRPPINNNYNNNNNNNNNRPGPGVLTGPLPSLNGDRQYHEYDRCKCAHSFNCESPGIQFGHCDTDKKYCCYNLKPGHRQEPNPGNRGPGGGFGAGPGSNGRPIYDRPVLVGPGGPTGIVSGPNRPPYSQYGREDTDNYRPRPDRNYYEPYGRSASSNQRKTVEKS
ncbi:unnamed protein product [Timema podura]|uniref:Uncharacterized protein n=1 Tax=Timema podura TaxID=61482 RepID=A0ABN7NGY9_TIMPD|nr:unnamed protein product [Timema podura]